MQRSRHPLEGPDKRCHGNAMTTKYLDAREHDRNECRFLESLDNESRQSRGQNVWMLNQSSPKGYDGQAGEGDPALQGRRPAFSMLEVMVSLALGSMIMMGMVQGYRNAVNVLSISRDLLSVNRRVALLLNQVERDFTTVMPYQKQEKMEKPTARRSDEKQTDEKQSDDKKKPNEKTKPENQKKGKKEKEPPILSLITNTFDDAAYRYQHKKWQMTQQVSFICTTPLEVFGSLHERRVRVGYELVYDKQKSSPQHSTYTLWRKESAELENMEFKEKEEGVPVRKHIVAQNIKAFSLEYTYKKRPEKDEQKHKSSQNKEEELVRTFTWGKDEEQKKSATLFPVSVAIHLELWDEQHKRSYPFDCMVPLLLQVDPPALQKEGEKQQQGQQQAQRGSEQSKQEAQQQGGGK